MSHAKNAWQTATGIGLATLIIAAWLALHVHDVFFYRWTTLGIIVAPFLIALQCWLNVGLFIIAHDCMHGSLAPRRPALNRAFGRLCLTLYAGFSYDRLRPKHFLHHAHPGTPLDPDFDAAHPDHFRAWFGRFFRTYFGIREFAVLTAILLIYLIALRASPADTLLFWGVPALLSATQLFYFGTYLPHRRDDLPFSDQHNARSSRFSWPVSLLTCFHFGYHHEHHTHPGVPWWRLPALITMADQDRVTRSMMPAAKAAPPAAAISSRNAAARAR